MSDIQLRPYQQEASVAILNEWNTGNKNTLLVLPTGCHALGEKLLTADGHSKKVEDIREGDKLLGPDGNSRTVLKRIEGTRPLFKVIPVKGNPFVVTDNHLLTLIQTNTKGHPLYPSQARGGEVTDVSVSEWLTWSKTKKHIFKLVRSSEIKQFEESCREQVIDPYFYGILLGDGHTKYAINITTAEKEVVKVIYEQAEKYNLHVRYENAGLAKTYFIATDVGKRDNELIHDAKEVGLFGCLSGEKFIHESYKYADIAVRLELLAGLIDSDGHLTINGYDYITKSQQLAEDIAFVCRSIGLAAYIRPCRKSCPNHTGQYYRISISGDCDKIPCRVARKKANKRRQKKNVLRTGFNVEYIGEGPYVGFTVDGDNHYLLDDFTITHNCGKTICFSDVISKRIHDGSKALVLAHRGELLNQAADKIKKVTGLDCAYEKASQSALNSTEPVTVGSVQSLSQPDRLSKFPKNFYSTIVVDEAHHCLADTYRRVLRHFDSANVLGVTATPDRGDKQELSRVFDSLAYEYTLKQAIAEKYLCPIKAKLVPLKLNILDVGMSNGDFSVGGVDSAIDPYLSQIAKIIARDYSDRKILIFLPLVKTSQKMRDLLEREGVPAAEVNGQTKDRTEVIKDFEEGRCKALCNAMLLTEGWDCPSVDCVIVLRPTRIRSLYAQAVGRGTRLYPGKKELLLLDFLWLTTRHDLCHPSSLIATNELEAMTMNDIVQQNGEAIDILDAQSSAIASIAEQRERALAEQLRRARGKKGKLVDPLQYFASIQAFDMLSYEPIFRWEKSQPSDKQLQLIEKYGINPGSVQNKGEAKYLIDQLIRRMNLKLASPKQIRCLESFGFNHVGLWGFQAASDMISQIADNHWEVPDSIVADSYVPL